MAAVKRNVKLTVAYDGTPFVGWQRQPDGVSVQGLIEKALSMITKQPITLLSSGRTDAGVHAQEMVAHFHTETRIPLKAFREGVNTMLPPEVAVLSATEASADFHARYGAVGKWYRYRFDQGEVRSPFNDRYVWRPRWNLDLDLMGRCAELYLGKHDFLAFRSSACGAKTTVREIFASRISFDEQRGSTVCFDVCGSGFLHNMVRVMAGTIVEVGMGKRSLDNVSNLLQGRSRDDAGITAPPSGLMLMKVWYDIEELHNTISKW